MEALGLVECRGLVAMIEAAIRAFANSIKRSNF